MIDHGSGSVPFSVTLELPGERLSQIVGENEDLVSLDYMEEYGAALAKLHRTEISAGGVADRKFFHAPSGALLASLGLEELAPFFAKAPEKVPPCFCHGDFHYANVLWDRHHISGILDLELSGYGDRDFDVAWALFRRPGQTFLKTETEQAAFLKGYSQFGEYDRSAVRFYMAQCYVYFLQFSADDAEYCSFVRSWLKKLI